MDTLMDNTTFAGAMRTLKPELPSHVSYISRYPHFKEVDILSFCEFLTAIVLYDFISLESSSKEIAQFGTNSPETNMSWVYGLLRHLPQDIKSRFREVVSSFSEMDSIRIAYNVMTSPLADTVRLEKNEKIPDIYYKKDYVYRSFFEELNNQSLSPLGETELVMSMFLHRGLYLQKTASEKKNLYMPHFYRGKMLSKIPPEMINSLHKDAFHIAQIPSGDDLALVLKEYSHEIDRFYFELIQKSSWINYNEALPFVGLSLYESSGRNPWRALDLALYYNQKSNLRQTWDELHHFIEKRDRPKAEKIVAQIKEELVSAARYLGVNLENKTAENTWKVITSVAPHGGVMDSIARILPKPIKDWAKTFANQFIANTPVQTLLISHINYNRMRF